MADYGSKRGQVALLLQLSMLASEPFKIDIPLQIFVRRTNLACLFIDSPKISAYPCFSVLLKFDPQQGSAKPIDGQIFFRP